MLKSTVRIVERISILIWMMNSLMVDDEEVCKEKKVECQGMRKP